MIRCSKCGKLTEISPGVTACKYCSSQKRLDGIDVLNFELDNELDIELDDLDVLNFELDDELDIELDDLDVLNFELDDELDIELDDLDVLDIELDDELDIELDELDDDLENFIAETVAKAKKKAEEYNNKRIETVLKKIEESKNALNRPKINEACPVCGYIQKDDYCICGYLFNQNTSIQNLMRIIPFFPKYRHLNIGETVLIKDLYFKQQKRDVYSKNKNNEWKYRGWCDYKQDQRNSIQSQAIIFDKNRIVGFTSPVDVPKSYIINKAKELEKTLYKKEQKQIQQEAVKKALLSKQVQVEEIRSAKCWSCNTYLSTENNMICSKCKWISCKCGACGCNYRSSY